MARQAFRKNDEKVDLKKKKRGNMAEKKKGFKAFKQKKSCPKCGAGTGLASHANRLYCGKCHYTEMVSKQ